MTVGIAEVLDGRVRLAASLPRTVEVLSALVLEREPPPWLGIATRDDLLDTSFIPEDEGAVLTDALGSADERDATLLALGRKFDDDYRRKLGLLGEELVVARCVEVLAASTRPWLASEVCHVSLISDQLGYDVRTPTVSGGHLRLEVKTTTTTEPDLRIFLSRNEWEAAKRDPSWRVVICFRSPDGDLAVAGWVRTESLSGMIPEDTAAGRWESVRLSVLDHQVEANFEGLLTT